MKCAVCGSATGPLFTGVFCKRFEEAVSEFQRVVSDVSPNFTPPEGYQFEYTTDDGHTIVITRVLATWEHSYKGKKLRAV